MLPTLKHGIISNQVNEYDWHNNAHKTQEMEFIVPTEARLMICDVGRENVSFWKVARSFLKNENLLSWVWESSKN